MGRNCPAQRADCKVWLLYRDTPRLRARSVNHTGVATLAHGAIFRFDRDLLPTKGACNSLEDF